MKLRPHDACNSCNGRTWLHDMNGVARWCDTCRRTGCSNERLWQADDQADSYDDQP